MGKKIHEQLGLTSRQKEILELVSKGCSNSDIAQLLKISPNTVKTHIATILERLNVSNRTEASVFYQQNFGYQETAEVVKHDALPEPIQVNCYCEGASSSLSQVTESFVQLLNAYEAIRVNHYYSTEDLEKESKADFIIRLQADAANDNSVQIVLLEPTESRRLLVKVEHSISDMTLDGLIQHAVLCYRTMMLHYSDQIQESRSNPSDLLIKALTLSESISYETQDKALSLCKYLIEQCPHWHLPYAIKASLMYRMATLGQTTDKESFIKELIESARKAFSINPASSWSQLSFAYFAMLSSDLELAKKHLKASIEANPCQYKAMHFLGQVLALEGNTQEGIEIYQGMLRKFPRSEADGLCYGALSLLYYCAKDYENSKQAAHRALMYEDAPKIPLILNLLSLAELEQDALGLETCLNDIKNMNISPDVIKASLSVASKIVPPELMEEYLASLKRAGLSI
jgi:DNA-binding CsgD family transcriptional regulator/tetratricopeptide (TPR) repeat protein